MDAVALVAAWARGFALAQAHHARPVEKLADTLVAHLAVHETGHLVVLWACTATEAIGPIWIDPNATTPGAVAGTVVAGVVTTEPDLGSAEDSACLWCHLVVLLAGVASEALVFGGVVGQRGDVERALVVAETLVAKGFEPPRTVWSGSIGSVESPLVLVEAAFLQAWSLIEKCGPRFDEVVRLLLEKGSLEESDLTPILGERLSTKALGKSESTFVY